MSFYKKILFVTVYYIFQTRTLRIQYSQFGTKMYIWYTAPSAKINYLGFTLIVSAKPKFHRYYYRRPTSYYEYPLHPTKDVSISQSPSGFSEYKSRLTNLEHTTVLKRNSFIPKVSPICWIGIHQNHKGKF